MPLNPGQILNNRYRIVKLLGQGGFGAVYKAWDTNLNGACAVKENNDSSSEATRQFTREATTNDMHTEAASAGSYHCEFWDKAYPRLQILTIEQLLSGAAVLMPPETGTFLAAQKVRKDEGKQGKFEIG